MMSLADFGLDALPECGHSLGCADQGGGTIDGSGAQWWTGSNKTPRRPYVLILPDATDVLLEDFLILNGAAWHTSLSGSNYRIYGVRIRWDTAFPCVFRCLRG